MNGWLLINKPIGISSAAVVGKVKWLLKLKQKKLKIGHAGTLDPLATGVLPLAIGEATKAIQFLLDSDKKYEFEVSWGRERDTDDAEGEVVANSELKPTNEQINKVIPDFSGIIKQMPPQYSALKIKGKKAYELAREGKEAKLKARNVQIYKLQLISHDGSKSQFELDCSKGTYVRSIARDMGRKLGCYGYVSKLHRVGHGKFDINQTISLEKLENLCEKGIEQQAILPVDEVLDDILDLKLEDKQAQLLRNGIVINIDKPDCDLLKIYHDNTLLAIAEIKNGKLKTRRVFNL